MEDFIWHKVSEKEREDIRKKAKQIMEDFGRKLEKVRAPEGHFSVGDGMRDQGEPWKTPQGFQDTMFSNAPDVKDDFIVAEKGAWK